MLRLASAASPQQFITPLQLIKLVYIAHGWSLHFMPETPLLSEPAQAWQYGPVVPSLYHAVKQFKSAPVAFPIRGDVDPQTLDGSASRLIKAVFESYAHLSGTQLSSLTHQPNTPWSNVWGVSGRNAVIPNSEIKSHYDKIAE